MHVRDVSFTIETANGRCMIVISIVYNLMKQTHFGVYTDLGRLVVV